MFLLNGEFNMKYLDRKKARQLALKELDKKEKIESIALALLGDEFWNHETIWENGKWKRNRSFKCYEMSYWATPIMIIYYKDGKEKRLDCYFTDEKRGKKIEEKIKLEMKESLKKVNKYLKKK